MMFPEQSIKKIIQEQLKQQKIPGMIIGITSETKETHVSLGYANIQNEEEIKTDTIFRIFSMSKPICAVAIAILVERGKISPNDLVETYLPSFSNMKYWNGKYFVPTKTPMQIGHLLTMTAGLTYDDDDDVVGRQTGNLFQKIHACMDQGIPYTTQMVAESLSQIPLSNEPGERWRYGLCADVLGAIIEKVSGKKLGDFYREEIFEPLHMIDTGFFVPKEKQNRFATLYERKKTDSSYRLVPDIDHHLGLGDFCSPPAFESAGAGLVSTYQDYTNFVQMLASGGMLDGTRILSKKTVKSFTRNQMTEEQTQGIYFDHMKGYGYGNLMRVRLTNRPADIPGVPTSFGWDGWCGPYMAVDLERKEGIVMFTQLSSYSDWDSNAKMLECMIPRSV